MIGRQQQPPRILNPQEQLQTDRPLKRMHVLTVSISKRQYTATTLAFDRLKGTLRGRASSRASN